MNKCVLLTMDKIDGHENHDQLLEKPMSDLGWKVEHIPWKNKNINWNDYSAVIIRTTWDYQENVEEFLSVLTTIDQSNARLINSIDIVNWNINKKYLQELESKNIEIVPTIWLSEFQFSAIPDYFSQFQTDQIVIKPAISANSENTFWLKKETFAIDKKILENSLPNKSLLVQPFMPAIIEEGEYSLFYFAGQYSHCILKKPKKGDFRVQEDYGSTITQIQPSKSLLKSAKKALNGVPNEVLYARIDLVNYKGSYKVMEVELIEPSLYFEYDKQSPVRFAQAFDMWMR